MTCPTGIPDCRSARSTILRITEESSTISAHRVFISHSHDLRRCSLAINSHGESLGALAATHLPNRLPCARIRQRSRVLHPSQHSHSGLAARCCTCGDDSGFSPQEISSSPSASRTLAASGLPAVGEFAPFVSERPESNPATYDCGGWVLPRRLASNSAMQAHCTQRK